MRAVVSGVKTNGNATIISLSDFHEFGMAMNNRTFTPSAYPFAYTGKESDPEYLGGNAYDFGARILDTRIGRWFKADPIATSYTDLSSYSYVANNPIIATDPDGERIVVGGTWNKALQRYEGGIEYVPGAGYKGNDQYTKDAYAEIDRMFKAGDEAITLAVKLHEYVNVVSNDGYANPQKTVAQFTSFNLPNNNVTIFDQNQNDQLTIFFNPYSGAYLFKTTKDKRIGRPYAYYRSGRVLSHEIRHFLHFIENPTQYQMNQKSFGSGNFFENVRIFIKWRNKEEKRTIEEDNRANPNEAQRTEHISLPSGCPLLDVQDKSQQFMPGASMNNLFQGGNNSGAPWNTGFGGGGFGGFDSSGAGSSGGGTGGGSAYDGGFTGPDSDEVGGNSDSTG